MPKILVIDDDVNLVNLIKIGLEKENFEVLTSYDTPTGLRTTFNDRPDLLILDIMMPGVNGIEACKLLREITETPIIMLTALSTESDIVKGLNVGADDYVTKPFGMAELVARINSCLRHKNSSLSRGKAEALVLGDLRIDFSRHKVSVRGMPVDLSPTEFRLLTYLAQHRGQVISHQQLLTAVWGPGYTGQFEYLHLYIRYLRKKIEKDPSNPVIIKTERSMGYYLESE